MEFTLRKNNGAWQNISAYREYLRSLQDGNYKVVVESVDKRSIPQNSYLHGVLIPEFKNALRSVGYDEVKTNEQTKEILKRMFLTTNITNKETGEVLEYVRGTHELTTGEMMVFIDEVIKFAAENMNYQIPLPNEQLEML